MIKRYVRRLPYAFAGIFYALSNDFGFRSQCYAGAVLAALLLYLLHPISTTEFLFLGIAAMFVLITELQNSAFEHALDHLHPEKHDAMKKSKDMAAGSVLLAGLFAFLVIVILCADRIFS